MRLLALSTLKTFWTKHPETKAALERWVVTVNGADWKTSAEVLGTFPKAKVLNSDRVRFEVKGGDYRLIAAFDLERSVVFVKFIGTHAEYDRIDALVVSQF